MKLNIYYNTRPKAHSLKDPSTLIITHDKGLKNLNPYLFIERSHRPEKNSLIISMYLLEYLNKNQIKHAHFKDSFEISYYLHYTNLFTVTYDSDELIRDGKTSLEYLITKETREFIIGKKDVQNFRNSNPSFSLILTTYNRSVELREALEALRNQTYINFELIVVNDGSNQEEIISYHDLLKEEFFSNNPKWIWHDQENSYLGAARNKGASLATGDVLIFIDDDNIPTPQMIERYHYYWIQYPYKIFNSCFDVFESETKKVLYPWAPFPDATFSSKLINVFGDAQMMIDKKLFKKLGMYTTDRLGYEDWELYHKIKLSGDLVFPIPERIYLYRIHPNNISMRANSKSIQNFKRALRPIENANPRLKRAHHLALSLFIKKGKLQLKTPF